MATPQQKKFQAIILVLLVAVLILTITVGWLCYRIGQEEIKSQIPATSAFNPKLY